jgi:hypothetical protein
MIAGGMVLDRIASEQHVSDAGVGRSGFLAVARLLRLATGCRVHVSGRPASGAGSIPAASAPGFKPYMDRDDRKYGSRRS